MLAFLAAMTFILYLDRSCINQAAPIIKKELGICETQKAIIFNAFALAYALFEIPAGRWGDRFGSRRILTRIVLWWSFFTALTGWPGDSRRWSSFDFCSGPARRGLCPTRRGSCGSGFPTRRADAPRGSSPRRCCSGGAASYTTSQWLIDWVGWRWSFAVFALIGVGWALAFYVWFRDDPAEHPQANDAERGLIAAGRMPGPSP